jgi:hypothetical protein
VTVNAGSLASATARTSSGTTSRSTVRRCGAPRRCATSCSTSRAG